MKISAVSILVFLIFAFMINETKAAFVELGDKYIIMHFNGKTQKEIREKKIKFKKGESLNINFELITKQRGFYFTPFSKVSLKIFDKEKREFFHKEFSVVENSKPFFEIDFVIPEEIEMNALLVKVEAMDFTGEVKYRTKTRRIDLLELLPQIGFYKENDDVGFVQIGPVKVGETSGTMYRVEILASKLQSVLKKSDLIFPLTEFLIDEITNHYKSPRSYKAWKNLVRNLSSMISLYNNNYYLFIQGSADRAVIGNNEDFKTVRDMEVSQYLNLVPKAKKYLGRKIWYFQKSNKNYRPFYNFNSSNIDSYNNIDLSFLRAAFIRDELKSRLANLKYPVAILEGEIKDNISNENFRTVAIYLYETKDKLELSMGRFNDYFLVDFIEDGGEGDVEEGVE